MPAALLCLIGCQLVGEFVREALHLPIPGPVIGMFLLAGVLAFGRRIPRALEQMADGLIGHMGLLFVPAGVGIVAEAGLLRQEWLPIVAALLGSTCLGVAESTAFKQFTGNDSETFCPMSSSKSRITRVPSPETRTSVS